MPVPGSDQLCVYQVTGLQSVAAAAGGLRYSAQPAGLSR